MKIPLSIVLIVMTPFFAHTTELDSLMVDSLLNAFEQRIDSLQQVADSLFVEEYPSIEEKQCSLLNIGVGMRIEILSCGHDTTGVEELLVQIDTINEQILSLYDKKHNLSRAFILQNGIKSQIEAIHEATTDILVQWMAQQEDMSDLLSSIESVINAMLYEMFRATYLEPTPEPANAPYPLMVACHMPWHYRRKDEKKKAKEGSATSRYTRKKRRK